MICLWDNWNPAAHYTMRKTTVVFMSKGLELIHSKFTEHFPHVRHYAESKGYKKYT